MLYNTDVLDIRFWLARYAAILSKPVPAVVPAKYSTGTGYLSRIMLGPLWQLESLLFPDNAEKLKSVKYNANLIKSK